MPINSNQGASMAMSEQAADVQKKDAENPSGGTVAPEEPRRACVRRVFIQPLVDDGLVRAKAVSVAEHQAYLDKLAERLAYLDEPMLATLREITLGRAEGGARNVWPAFATIWNTATRLRTPPDNERHIMTTWLASVEGPIAEEAGHLAELHLWLRKHGCPPSAHGWSEIKQEADENARTRRRIAADIEAGRARPSEVDWLRDYLRHLDYCRRLVAGGVAKRAAAAGVVA